MIVASANAKSSGGHHNSEKSLESWNGRRGREGGRTKRESKHGSLREEKKRGSTVSSRWCWFKAGSE